MSLRKKLESFDNSSPFSRTLELKPYRTDLSPDEKKVLISSLLGKSPKNKDLHLKYVPSSIPSEYTVSSGDLEECPETRVREGEIDQSFHIDETVNKKTNQVPSLSFAHKHWF